MDMSLPHAGKGHKPFQVCPSELFSSCTVHKTCGTASGNLSCEHLTALLMIFWRASQSEFLLKLETSSDRSREVPDTSYSSVADGSRHF